MFSVCNLNTHKPINLLSSIKVHGMTRCIPNPLEHSCYIYQRWTKSILIPNFIPLLLFFFLSVLYIVLGNRVLQLIAHTNDVIAFLGGSSLDSIYVCMQWQSQTHIEKRVCFHSHSIHINRTNFGWNLFLRYIYIVVS